jgi:predicted PhzF superfamily epimerase YddE/YHI9
MRCRYYTCDVSAERRFGGNPLAVLPEAAGLSGEQMQRIAREFNYSETTFVLPPEDPAHTRKVRIFTPGAEIPFAGHPNVGTAFVLAATGALRADAQTLQVVFEEGVGPVPVEMRYEDGQPAYGELIAPQALALGATPPVDAVGEPRTERGCGAHDPARAARGVGGPAVSDGRASRPRGARRGARAGRCACGADALVRL